MKKTILMTLIAKILLNGSISLAGNDNYVWRFNCQSQANCQSTQMLDQILVVNKKNDNLDALSNMSMNFQLNLQYIDLHISSDGTIDGYALFGDEDYKAQVTFDSKGRRNYVMVTLYNKKYKYVEYQDGHDQRKYRKGTFGNKDLR